MATLTKAYTFSDDTVVVTAAQVNQLFDDVITFITTGGSASQVDGSQSFTANVLGPATNPVTATSAVRKRYADNSPEMKGTGTALVNNGSKPSLTSGKWRWQGGTAVLTLDGFHRALVTYPTAFTGGLLTISWQFGDDNNMSFGALPYSQNEGLSSFEVIVPAGVIGTNVRLNWLALGWVT